MSVKHAMNGFETSAGSALKITPAIYLFVEVQVMCELYLLEPLSCRLQRLQIASQLSQYTLQKTPRHPAK